MKKSAASGRGSALKVKFNPQRLLAKESLLENVKKNNIHTYEGKKMTIPTTKLLGIPHYPGGMKAWFSLSLVFCNRNNLA